VVLRNHAPLFIEEQTRCRPAENNEPGKEIDWAINKDAGTNIIPHFALKIKGSFSRHNIRRPAEPAPSVGLALAERQATPQQRA
jgi:hypothetical protein